MHTVERWIKTQVGKQVFRRYGLYKS